MNATTRTKRMAMRTPLIAALAAFATLQIPAVYAQRDRGSTSPAPRESGSRHQPAGCRWFSSAGASRRGPRPEPAWRGRQRRQRPRAQSAWCCRQSLSGFHSPVTTHLLLVPDRAGDQREKQETLPRPGAADPDIDYRRFAPRQQCADWTNPTGWIQMQSRC